MLMLLVTASAGPLKPPPPVVYVSGRADFPAGSDGVLATSGDFNGDGQPDLVATSFNGNSVSVILGLRNGGFSAPVSYPVGLSPVAAAVGDFNGDGKLDLVVVNQVCAPNSDCSPGSVSILLGNGDGTFQPHVDYETGPNPLAVVVGDFNGDGKLDLAVADAVSIISTGSNGLVSLLLGNGDGTFQHHADFSAGTGVIGLTAGDFNGDGKLDLVVDNHPSLASNTVSLLLGNGDGTLQAPSVLTVGGDPLDVAVSDFNHDGKMDLAVATGSSTVSVLLGNGDGTFQPHQDYATGFGPSSLIATDLNGDGKPDLVVSINTLGHGPGAGGISVLLGKGDGTFRRHSDYETGSSGRVVAGDFNHDGKLDVAIANSLWHTVTVALGNGDGTLSHPRDYATGNLPFAVATGDFNGDGNLDLVIVNFLCNIFPCPGSSISVLLGRGDGTFGSPRSFRTGNNPTSVAVADFNGDGKLDLAVANSSDDTVTILLGRGDGTFFRHQVSATGVGPAAVITGDFNGDGTPDLAVTNVVDGSVSILLGLGNGSFAPHVDYAAGPGAQGIVAGDFNGDGKLDLAVADSNTPVGFRGQGLVSVLLGNGDGTFQPHQDSTTQSIQPVALAAGDFDRDGKLDLAVAGNLGEIGKMTVLKGKGDGTFRVASSYFTGSLALAITSGDFFGNGKTDVAIANLGTNTVTLLKNTWGGKFRLQSNYGGPGIAPIAIATGDFDGDSRLDMVVVNAASNTVSVYLNSEHSGKKVSTTLDFTRKTSF